MKSIRLMLVAAALMVIGFATAVSATSWSNDQSDLWWNTDESGWGIQFVQRGSTMFATMFVYDASSNPTWYTAFMNGTKTPGTVTFTGDLYATHGPWFGATSYDPLSVKGDKVGTMTWQNQPSTPGTLTYSVNGVNVTKTLTRQPIRNDNYTGTYFAGLHAVESGCLDPANNGVADGGGTLTVSHTGSVISMNFAGQGFNCTLAGTYSQAGQFGGVSGNFSCMDGDMGTFSLSNGYVSPFAMAFRLSLASTITGCQDTGQIGGVRTDQ